MMIAKKFRKSLFVLVALLVGIYAWEYYCTTRPVGQCGKLCETRSQVIASFGGRSIRSYMCHPWYRYYWR